MTVEKLEHVIGIIEESEGTSTQVDTVWEYENAYNHKIMFAVFTIVCINDIYASQAVLNPVKIYDKGVWLGTYSYLNRE